MFRECVSEYGCTVDLTVAVYLVFSRGGVVGLEAGDGRTRTGTTRPLRVFADAIVAVP